MILSRLLGAIVVDKNMAPVHLQLGFEMIFIPPAFMPTGI